MEIYEPVNKSLQLVGSLMNAAEAHGILCGLLCSSLPFPDEVWLKHVLGESALEDNLIPECQKQLLLTKTYTLNQLNSPNCEFMPLLPDDDIPLPARAEALGGWCEGFLFGLGLMGIETQNLPEYATEFIGDVISISRLASVPNDSEENEESYTQLTEYIKIGVINLYEELTLTDGQYG